MWLGDSANVNHAEGMSWWFLAVLCVRHHCSSSVLCCLPCLDVANQEWYPQRQIHFLWRIRVAFPQGLRSNPHNNSFELMNGLLVVVLSIITFLMPGGCCWLLRLVRAPKLFLSMCHMMALCRETLGNQNVQVVHLHFSTGGMQHFLHQKEHVSSLNSGMGSWGGQGHGWWSLGRLGHNGWSVWVWVLFP